MGDEVERGAPIMKVALIGATGFVGSALLKEALNSLRVSRQDRQYAHDEGEPNAADVVATFDVKAGALLDVVRGRFDPSGKLPLSIPADQAAVDNNAPDVPGYLESFDYAYRSKVGDKYLFGFGLSYGR